MKKILIVADEPGWIFERHAIEIRKRLKEFSIDIAFRKMNIPKMSKEYDLIYVMDPIPLKYGYPSPEKTIMGLRCEFLYKDHPMGARGVYWRGYPGKCVSIQDKCMAFHVVNKNQIKAFKDVVLDKPLILAQHGVDEKIFNDGFKRDYGRSTIKVGVAGRKSPNKGFKLIEQACQMAGVDFVRAEYGNTKLPKSKMPDYYKFLDIYVCMSKTEGLNNGILEAGATGLPIISTKSGAAEEIIFDNFNGYITQRTPQALAHLIVELKDPKLREKMGKNMAKEILENWTWEKKIEDFRKMFRRTALWQKK